jgi:hypothetical protein
MAPGFELSNALPITMIFFGISAGARMPSLLHAFLRIRHEVDLVDDVRWYRTSPFR